MKKFTILLCLLVATAGFAQVDLEDFDGMTAPTVGFLNGPGSATIIPDPTGDGNGNVLEVITAASSAPWQQAELILQTDLDMSNADKTVSVYYYSLDPIEIMLGISQNPADSAPATTAEAAHPGGGWTTLDFDFNFIAQAGGVPTADNYQKLFFFPLWNIGIGDFNGGGSPTGSTATLGYVDLIQGPEAPSCTTTLGATSATCETSTGSGATDDTYSATVDFSNGLNGNVYVVSANSGTVGGDDPNVVASGTITVTGITEGTNLTLTVSDVADGGDCDLSTIVTSPSCIPAPTLTVLEDFEPTAPSLTFTNGTGSATVIPDPTADGRGGVLEIITAAAQAPWQQAELTLQDDFVDLTTSDKSIFIDWYSTTPFDALLGVRVGGPDSDAQASHGGTGWETLEFNFNSPENLLSVANGIYQRLFLFPLWDADAPRPGATGDDGWFINAPDAAGSIASTTYVDIIQGPVLPICETALGSTSALCDTPNGPGPTDDTYTASVNFTGGLSGNVYVITSTSGTVGGDDPNLVASGTITVTGIIEGTDVTISVDDTADGGLCSLSTVITSPICLPAASLDLLEDFEGTTEITTANGLGGANITADPLDAGNTVLEIISADSGESWQQANVLMQDFFMDVNATVGFTVEVDVYATQDFTMLARLDDLYGAPPAAATATSQDFVSGSGWQTLTFSFDQPEDLPSVANGQYSQIAFLPNWNPAGGWFPPGNFTVYVDDIRAVQGDPIPEVPIFYVYNNGVWAPSDPTGGNSGSIDDINIINGDVVISDDLECEDLTIQPGASMTIDSGVAVTTSTTTLFSTSSTFSSLILNGTMSGTINYHRFTTIVGINDLASPPLSGQTFGPFAGVNLNLPQQGDLRAYGPYDTVAGEYVNYDVVANAATVLESGVGYRAATIDGNRLIYEGTPLSTDVLDVPITDAIAGKAWNLIGNPYPSYMDFDTFFNANLSAFESDGAFLAIYGYDGNAVNGWKIWNLATIADNAVTELIAPGQGFFVKSAVGGGLVDYTTAMRRTGTSDDFIQGFTANNLDVALSELSLTSDSNVSSTSIYFIEGTTRSLDPGYDAGSYQGSAGEFSIFTNLVEDNEGLDMQIQTLPYNDFNDVVIPLGIKALAGTSLTIGLEENLNSPVPSNVNVYLEDTLLNTLTLLNTSEYTFTPSSDMIGTGRFFLRYSAETLSTVSSELDNMLIYADNANDNIVIKGQLTEKSNVILYDIHGRVILSQDLDNSNAVNTIDVNSVSTGIYIVEISNGNTTATQKLVIK